VPRCKEEDEKNIKVYSASLAALSSRAAGGESKSVLFEISFDRGASQIAKVFAFSLACDFRVGVFL
jgi:hypothetical protein